MAMRTACGILVLLAIAATVPDAQALDVGDTAPAPQVESWVGGTALTAEAMKGKILVVEFWATWCQPCRRTAPHLNKVHAKYKDKGVVVMGITEEKEGTVAKFLKTVSMDYHVGIDKKGKTNNTYMNGVPGIPHAFVVGRDGKVAWHGHPLGELERVVEQMVAGTFDVERSKTLAALKHKLQAVARGRDNEKIMAVVDETITKVPDDPAAYRIKRAMLQRAGKNDEAWATLLAMAQGCAGDYNVLIEVALTLCVSPDLGRRDLPKALELVKKAVDVAEKEKARALAALARVHYEMGHVALAAKAAADAAKQAEGKDKERFESHAGFYRNELKRRKKDPDTKL